MIRCWICRQPTNHRIVVMGKHSGAPLVIPACVGNCVEEAQGIFPPGSDRAVS